ncbi:MAG: phosphomannomutase/phosphoglucomutase [Prevotellaceae bacterium]|jgi:phosphomannomutase|nr:phosphomannomutase/phosphoglucomutase [Prevotellaceae bacterium]
MGAFHAYDIRGIWNKDFNKDDVYKIGFFLPALLNAYKILVGRDVRTSSPEIYDALTRGITDAGADVYDIGLATTPMVYFATASKGFKASVQITASHNSKEYNGLKVSGENALPIGYDAGLGQLEQRIKTQTVKPVDKKGKIIPMDIKPEYIAFLKNYKGDYNGLKIGIDLSNGMAALLIKDILDDEPIYLFDELDGTFPNHEANPLDLKNIIDIQILVKKEKCDIGIIFDGDADRVMFIDENARFISPDLMIAVLGHYFLEEKGLRGNVLQDIRTSKAIGEYLTPMGASMHTWKVGRAFAARKLREIDGIFGGELAGHYYFRDFFYSDSGILACLIILDIVASMKAKGISVSRMISKIETYKNSGEINFRIQNKQQAMDAVREYFLAKEKPVAQYNFDGYRIEFPDWWFNIRPSNTEPYLRFITEAKTSELLDEKVKDVKNILSGID